MGFGCVKVVGCYEGSVRGAVVREADAESNQRAVTQYSGLCYVRKDCSHRPSRPRSIPGWMLQLEQPARLC